MPEAGAWLELAMSGEMLLSLATPDSSLNLGSAWDGCEAGEQELCIRYANIANCG